MNTQLQSAHQKIDTLEAQVEGLFKHLPKILAQEFKQESEDWAVRTLRTGASEADTASAQAVTQFADLMAQRFEEMSIETEIIIIEAQADD